MLLPTPSKCWIILCCLSISIALVNSAVLAQLARANQARVVARQTTQRQVAHARAAAAATAARTRAQALLGPGARLGLARHGGILGDSQRVARGSGDFFNEANGPIQDQISFNNDPRDGSNRATVANGQFLLDERLGATMPQEHLVDGGNFLSNERVGAAMIQEPGANCGCKRRIVIIPEASGTAMRQSEIFTVLSDTPVEARMISDQGQEVDIQGAETEPQFDEQVRAERTHLIHQLIHKKLHKSPETGFQQVQGHPVNVHVVQNQNLAALARASSSEMDETEADFSNNQGREEMPQMDAGVLEPQNDEEVGAERFHHIHEIIHNKFHKNQKPAFQTVPQTPINIHVTQNQHGAVISRSSSDETNETEERQDMNSNQGKEEIPQMDAGALEPQNDEEVGAERFHHIHEMIHNKFHKNQEPAFQNVPQTPINIHVTQNQHGAMVSRSSSDGRDETEGHEDITRIQQRFDGNDQVVATQSIENQAQNVEPVMTPVRASFPAETVDAQRKQVVGPQSSGELTKVMNDDQSGPTPKPLPATKTDAQKEQVGVPFSEALNDEQVGVPLSTPFMSDKTVDANDEQVGAPLDDLIEKIDARLSERLGAERTHHIHEILHKNLHRPQAASQHGHMVAPVNVNVIQNQHAVVAPRMASAESTGPSSEGKLEDTEPTKASDAVAKAGTPTEQVAGNTGSSGGNSTGVVAATNPEADETGSQSDEQVGASAPTEQLGDEVRVGGMFLSPYVHHQEQVGAFVHQNIHKGVFVPKPVVHHGFGSRPAGVIVHNQHSIFGLRSASGEEDGSAETTALSNNKHVDVQSQTDAPTKTETIKIDNENNEDPKVRENVDRSDFHDGTPAPAESENKSQLITTTALPIEKSISHNVDQVTDAQNDEHLGGERTAHLIHKIHKKLHGPPETIHGGAPVNINIVQNQQATLKPRESSGQEVESSKDSGNLSMEPSATHSDSETPSSARHLNHGFTHRFEHSHSTGTILPGISSFLNGLSGGTSSNINVIQNQNANVSPQNPSAITNVNLVQNQNAAVGPQRPTTFIPSSGGVSTNVEVFQNQNAVVGPQMTTSFVPVSSFGGASANFNQGIQSTDVIQNQKTVIVPSTSHVDGLSIGTQGFYQGLPSIQRPFGHLGGHATVHQSQSATIGRNADGNQAMEDIDVPDVEVRNEGTLADGDDDNTDSGEVVGTYLHPHDPYYDNDNFDKTKMIDLIEDKKRIITKVIDTIKSKHDKILDSLKPKLQKKKHQQYYTKPQYPEEPQYQQYPAYAHDYNDQLPELSWEYDPHYRTNSREESDESADIHFSERAEEEHSANEDNRNIDSDSLRYERSTKVNLDNLLKKEEEAVTDLKKYVKRDEDLMMIDYVAEKVIDDINEKQGHMRKKRQIVADKKEFQRILTDPNTKLDMTKTLENVGTVARSAIEHQRAPLYHFRNAVGSVRDAMVATMKIPNQNFIIPAQYDIVNQQDAPQLGSRFGGGNGQRSDDPVTDTFQKVGSVVRSTIKSGQEAIGHIGQAANHARTAIYTTQHATPRLRLAKIPARVHTPRLSSRMGGDETVGEQEPKDFVNLGRIMDAVGISNPDSTVGSESIVFVPRSRMAAMRNRFRVPEQPKSNQQDPVVGATMKNLREAQQTVGAHSLGDLLKRMRDGLQGFVKHDILGIRDEERQNIQEKKGNKQPVIGSRSSIPTTEVQPKQTIKNTNPRKPSNITQTQKQDDIVGSGLPLAPELLHPFMNRATFDQEKKFLNMFNSNPKNQKSNDEHLGDVLGAINPIMFQRVFQEKLKENSTEENTPHDVFHHHHDGHSHGEHEVTDQNEKSENVSTSMKIQGPFLKPFMGQPSRKNIEKFFSKYQKSSGDQSHENPEMRERDDGPAMQSVEGNDLQDINQM